MLTRIFCEWEVEANEQKIQTNNKNVVIRIILKSCLRLGLFKQ